MEDLFAGNETSYTHIDIHSDPDFQTGSVSGHSGPFDGKQLYFSGGIYDN
jgi:hypothetical protein